MLKKSEIYLLNTSLDGKEIYGLPNDIFLKNENDGNVVLKSLREKKILNNDNSFNELSYLIVKNLDIYKKAKSYIWINDVVFSLDDTNFLLSFSKDDITEEFHFEKITKEILLIKLLKEYEVLCSPKEVTTDSIEKIDAETFIKNYVINSKINNQFIIKKDDGNYVKVTTYYKTFFEMDRKFYCYNIMTQELQEYNPYDARIEIVNLLQIRR